MFGQKIIRPYQPESSSSTPTFKDKVLRVRNYQERSVPKFLKKVFNILESGEFNEYISWSSDGCALILKKPTEFAEKVLPLYFKHNNFASFVRQLNMYNFKKKKNYHYDHVYGHEMFQHGRIDLLKNIQRKCPENTPIVSVGSNDLKTHKEDIELDVNTLIQENLNYKRVHKSLSTQLQFIESKMKDLKNEIQTLNHQQRQYQANEAFLKNVIKTISTYYGPEAIQKAIEVASFESSWPSEPETALESIPQKQSSCDSFAYDSNYDQSSQGYYSSNPENLSDQASDPMMFSSSNNHNSNNNQYYQERITQDQPIHHSNIRNYGYESQPQNLPAAQDLQAFFENDEVDQKVENNSASSHSYMSWYMEFERNHLNADAFLESNPPHGNLRDNGNLDIDYHFSENQLLKADF